jgi:NADH-quinone oxidoreductase subunit J
MTIDLVLLYALIVAALWTVMTARLIRSVMGLALVSAILAVIIYRLGSPLAAVFELSVCAGLIPVIFITTVSFTQRVSKDELTVRRKERFAKYWLLPVIVIAAGCWLFRYLKMPQIPFSLPVVHQDVRAVLWNARPLDLLGQVVMLLAGVLGVVVFFKEPKK